jgi:L-threonylcarbamoyladenylate synthase
MAGLDGAVRALGAGRIVAYPTDTLLGLGVRAGDARALARLAAMKGRPNGMPVSIAVSSIEEVEALTVLAPMGRRFVRTHLPGPYTVLARPSVRATARLARLALGPAGVVGLRVPDHPLARELARRAGPITSTSANRHGSRPCRTMAETRRTFGDEVAVYLAGGPRPSDRPSMIVDLTRAEPSLVARR